MFKFLQNVFCGLKFCLIEKEYLVPLRNPENQSICEPRLVEEIFFQIPEILQKHEELCADIQSYIDNWDTGNMKIGELFLNFVSLLDNFTFAHLSMFLIF